MRKVKREYKPKVERKISNIDAQQYLRRHEYCVPVRLVIGKADEATIQRLSEKGQLKGHCDHPEDGYCSSFITPERLAEVNARLAGDTPIEASEKGVEAEKIKPNTGSNNVKTFFCLECREIHKFDPQIATPDHWQYRRKRGRPKK